MSLLFFSNLWGVFHGSLKIFTEASTFGLCLILVPSQPFFTDSQEWFFLVSQSNVILCLKFAQCLFIPIRKEKSLKCIHITCKNFCQPSLPISSGSPLSSLQTSHSLSGIPGCTAISAVCTPSPSCPPGSLY